MSRKCAFPGCVPSQKTRFFPFPSVKKSSPELTKRRLSKWISLLGLKPDFDPSDEWVCGTHFVRGNPAKDTDVLDIDWVPTIKASSCSTVLVDDDPAESLVEYACPEEDGKLDEYSSTLCRACGQNLPDDPALSDSFQNYAHMYLEFTNLQLHPRENPEELRICPDCKNKLHEFQQLRETFINVHWRLLEVKPELRDNHEGFDSNAVVEKNPSINEAIVSDINSLEQDVSQNDLYNQTTEQLESIVKVEPVDYCSEDNADDRNEQKAFGYSFQITKESSSDSELSTSSTSDDQSEMLPPTMKKKKKSLEELYPYDKSQRNKFYIPRKRKKFPRQFDCRCPKKCSTLFESEQVLEHFFHKFWASVDKTRQRKMVLEYVRAMPVRRIRCRPQRVRPERAVMFQYFVPTEDCDVRVCQRFFLGILQTTSQTVYRYIYGKTGDRDSAQDEIIIP